MSSLLPRPVKLAGDRSHGEDWESITFPRRADPPPASGGVGNFGADATAADTGGGVGSFTLRDGELSGWDLLVMPDGCNAAPTDLQELVEALAAGPEFRSAALLRAMERFRDALDQLPGHTPIETGVTVAAADLLVLVRALLGRLR
jgi:hypothetical protein